MIASKPLFFVILTASFLALAGARRLPLGGQQSSLNIVRSSPQQSPCAVIGVTRVLNYSLPTCLEFHGGQSAILLMDSSDVKYGAVSSLSKYS